MKEYNFEVPKFQSFINFKQKCKTEPLTFSLFHFSPLTFNFYQFGILLNPSYVLPLIEPKQRRFGFFFFNNKFRNLK